MVDSIVPQLSESQILDIMLKIEELRKAAKAEAEAKAKAEAKAAEPTEAAVPQVEAAVPQVEAAGSQEEATGGAEEEESTLPARSTHQVVLHGWKLEVFLTREGHAKWRARFQLTPPESRVRPRDCPRFWQPLATAAVHALSTLSPRSLHALSTLSPRSLSLSLSLSLSRSLALSYPSVCFRALLRGRSAHPPGRWPGRV